MLRSEPYCISPFLSTSNLLTYCQLSDYTALYVPLMKNTPDLNNRTRLSVAICILLLILGGCFVLYFRILILLAELIAVAEQYHFTVIQMQSLSFYHSLASAVLL